MTSETTTNYDVVMTTPRSIRFDAQTLTGIATFVARNPGFTGSSAAALLVEEGLRMDSHPGILFRPGPRGRRAVIAGGPDVWEVVRAIRATRTSEPSLETQEVLALVSETSGLAPAQIHIAVQYYGDYPVEIDAQIADAETAELAALESVQQTRSLLQG